MRHKTKIKTTHMHARMHTRVHARAHTPTHPHTGVTDAQGKELTITFREILLQTIGFKICSE